jgi:hypothetical protein
MMVRDSRGKKVEERILELKGRVYFGKTFGLMLTIIYGDLLSEIEKLICFLIFDLKEKVIKKQKAQIIKV